MLTRNEELIRIGFGAETWSVPSDVSTGAERRLAERVLLDFEVDYTSNDTFLFAYARNISNLGIFLQTREPKPPGTRLHLRFALPSRSAPLEVEGVVRWINPYRPGDINNINPGMGIEFQSLTEVERDRIVDLIRLIAYLA